ncbi:MAG: carboxypeptidase-like regulatory domain-containing protein [Longimicrobiales bacterium]|nr:carboxypeptidase-like regulatory domain-containing protein [Longimicrobiales bacterium]
MPARSRTNRSLSPAVTGLLALALLLVGEGTPLHAQIVAVGLVTDEIRGEPLGEVKITLTLMGAAGGEGASVVATTDDAGRFAALLPGPGTYELEARHLRYQPLIWSPIEAREGQEQVELIIELTPAAAELEGIDVEVEEERRRSILERNGFFDRERRGFGVHLSPEDLEYRRYNVKLAFRGIPGLQVTPDDRLRMIGGSSFTGATCIPNYFLDGTRMQGQSELLDFVSLQDVQAVEIYRRASEIPVEFGGMTSNGCGVILVWTGR